MIERKYTDANGEHTERYDKKGRLVRSVRQTNKAILVQS